MNILKGKLAVYDSDCALCRSARRFALRLGVIGDEDCVALYDVPPQYKAAVDAERFRREMALIDTQGGQTLYGVDGLLAVCTQRYAVLAPLCSLRVVRSLCKGLYSIVAPNRYVISTPRQGGFVCSCSSIGHCRDRLRYIAAGTVFSLVLTVLFVHAVRTVLPAENWLVLLVSIMAGWAVYGCIAALALREQIVEFIAHNVSVMWRGAAMLLPVIVVSWIGVSAAVLVGLAALSVAVSFVLMLRQHERRMAALNLYPFWTALWGALLWGGVCSTLALWGVL